MPNSIEIMNDSFSPSSQSHPRTFYILDLDLPKRYKPASLSTLPQKPFFQPQPLLQWCKVILIPPSSWPLSPGDNQSKQSQKLAVIYCGHHPQANQQLKNEPLWPYFPDQGAMGPFQVMSKQRAVALRLFKCPLLTCVPLMSNFSKITNDNIHVQLLQPAIFSLLSFPKV